MASWIVFIVDTIDSTSQHKSKIMLYRQLASLISPLQRTDIVLRTRKSVGSPPILRLMGRQISVRHKYLDGTVKATSISHAKTGSFAVKRELVIV